MALEAFSLIGRVALDGADRVASGLDGIGSHANAAGQHIERFGTETFRTGSTTQRVMTEAERSVREMRQEMRQLLQENRTAMAPFREEQMRIQRAFYDLTLETENWSGSTEDLMSRLEELGVAQREATSAMTSNNAMARMGFLQSVASMLAMKTQSAGMISTFNRMGNPLYQANNGLLRMSGSLESLAHRAQPAALALRMLGANASMSQLNSLTRQMTAGIMRMQAVAMGAVIVVGLMVAGLHGAAMENEKYAASFNEMKEKLRKAFQPMVDVFVAAMVPIFDFISAIADLMIKFNEAHPMLAKMIQGFLLLIPVLTLILAPLAAGVGLISGFMLAWGAVAPVIMPLITGLAAMSATVWIVAAAIVALIAIGVALYTHWDQVVAWLKAAWDSIKNYFMGFVPAIQAGWAVFTAWLSGFWEGVKAVFAAVGTFLLNWTPFGWLLKTIMANMDSIKKFISITMQMIKALWTVAWNAIKAVFTPIINGIKTAATTVFNALKTYFTTTFNAYKTVFTTVFNGIKNTATTIFNAIKTAMTKPLNAAKTTISGILSSIKSLFTKLVLKIPKPKMPIINIGMGHKSIKGVDIPYPKISFGGWKAKGGLFNQPELVGIGERGREAIIPLENRRYFAPFSRAIAENISALGGGAAAATGGRLEVPIYLNNREIVRAIVADLDKALAQRAKRSSGLVNRGNL